MPMMTVVILTKVTMTVITRMLVYNSNKFQTTIEIL